MKQITVNLTKKPTDSRRELGAPASDYDRSARSIREHASNAFKAVKFDLGSKKVNRDNYKAAIVDKLFSNKKTVTIDEVADAFYQREVDRHKVINEHLHRHLDPILNILSSDEGMKDYPFYK